MDIDVAARRPRALHEHSLRRMQRLDATQTSDGAKGEERAACQSPATLLAQHTPHAPHTQHPPHTPTAHTARAVTSAASAASLICCSGLGFARARPKTRPAYHLAVGAPLLSVVSRGLGSQNGRLNVTPHQVRPSGVPRSRRGRFFGWLALHPCRPAPSPPLQAHRHASHRLGGSAGPGSAPAGGR